MEKYRIVAARSKDEDSDLKSEFNIYKWIITNEKSFWRNLGWKTIHDVSDLINGGHEVLTGKIVDNKIKDGAAVELELRIAYNETKYKISEMPSE